MSNKTTSNPSPANLENLRRFVSSHGHDAWIEGQHVYFTSWSSKPVAPGAFDWKKEIVAISTLSEARNALGY